MFNAVVYPKANAISRNGSRALLFQLERVTATAADVIRTSTPVAYAPPCASTLAWNSRVTVIAMDRNTNTSGREPRAHSGAMPNLGRYLGIKLSNPAMAEAPANARIRIVLKSYTVPKAFPRYLCPT